MPEAPPPGKRAGSARVGEKGQIVIPKEIRDLFGIGPGDTLLLLADQDKGIAVLPPHLAIGLMETVLGDIPDRAAEDQDDAPPVT